MHIEFKTMFDNTVNEHMAKLYVNHFMDKQNKQCRNTIILTVVFAAMSVISGILNDMYYIGFIGIAYLAFILIVINLAKKKTIPKNLIEVNGVGCPFNETVGLYDEYFYVKFENNMSISEHSIRYEFLSKILETPDCFVLMTKRSHFFYFPKRDMGYENVIAFSEFCKTRLPYIYKSVK